MSETNLSRRQVTAMVTATAALSATPALAAYQPHMTLALSLCQKALHELQISLPNKGGHRVNAIKHLEYVIQEIKLGIQAGN